MRREAKQEPSVIVVGDGVGGPDRVLVDSVTLNPDGTVSAYLMDVSEDGRIPAWAKGRGGEDELEVFLLDFEGGQTLADHLPRGGYYWGSISILPDRSGCLYSRRHAEGMRIMEHRFGTSIEVDQELFGTSLPDDQ